MKATLVCFMFTVDIVTNYCPHITEDYCTAENGPVTLLILFLLINCLPYKNIGLQ